jgi:hypothetical protein
MWNFKVVIYLDLRLSSNLYKITLGFKTEEFSKIKKSFQKRINSATGTTASQKSPTHVDEDRADRLPLRVGCRKVK